jgi:tripartite-type tricarboxylate transporter receptor subunit TctC
MRAFQPHLERELGVPIVIQNMPGAGGIVGAEHFHRQPADGYTFSMYTPSHTIAAITGTTSFDILNETEPVAVLVQAVKLILAGNHTPFTTFEELVEAARANPGRYKIAVLSVAGVDGASLVELFGMVDVDIPMVAFANRAEASAAVIGGHIDMLLGDPVDAQFIESGDMRGLVVLSNQRIPSQPDIPTTVELGFDATIGPWRALVARRGVPEAAMRSMEQAIYRANQAPAWIEYKAANDLDIIDAFMLRDDFKVFWMEQYEKFRTAMESLGM